jgi:hypothetical protein
VVVLAPAVSRADDARHSAGAEVAAVGAAVRDDLMVPLASTGFSISLGIEYLGDVGPGVLDVALRMGAGTGWDRVGAQALVIEDGIGVRYYLPTGTIGGWRLDTAGELGLLGAVGRPAMVRGNKQDPQESAKYLLIDVYDRPELGWPGNWQLVRARIELSRSERTSFVDDGWRFGVEARLARIDEPALAFATQIKLVAARRWTW